MKRRTFVKAAAAGVATAAAASSFSAPALSQGKKQWKMALTWPANTPGLGLAAKRVAKRIGILTEGKIKIKVYGANELVPAFESFNACSAGDVEMYQAAEYYWQGHHKAFNRYFPDSIRIVANRRRTRPPMEGILLCGHSAAPI